MHLARKQILLLIMISATLGLASYFSGESHAQAVRTRTDGPPFLRDGKRVTGKLDLNGDAWQTYRIEVPENAISIDIEVDEGSSVRAVFPGQVLYAAPFEGYGTMVVVHHPGRVFTLYAGLRELQVGKGDVLSLGDVVGHSADVVYFEVRVENEPQDPLLWLR